MFPIEIMKGLYLVEFLFLKNKEIKGNNESNNEIDSIEEDSRSISNFNNNEYGEKEFAKREKIFVKNLQKIFDA